MLQNILQKHIVKIQQPINIIGRISNVRNTTNLIYYVSVTNWHVTNNKMKFKHWIIMILKCAHFKLISASAVNIL